MNESSGVQVSWAGFVFSVIITHCYSARQNVGIDLVATMNLGGEGEGERERERERESVFISKCLLSDLFYLSATKKVVCLSYDNLFKCKGALCYLY